MFSFVFIFLLFPSKEILVNSGMVHHNNISMISSSYDLLEEETQIQYTTFGPNSIIRKNVHRCVTRDLHNMFCLRPTDRPLFFPIRRVKSLAGNRSLLEPCFYSINMIHVYVLVKEYTPPFSYTTRKKHNLTKTRENYTCGEFYTHQNLTIHLPKNYCYRERDICVGCTLKEREQT